MRDDLRVRIACQSGVLVFPDLGCALVWWRYRVNGDPWSRKQGRWIRLDDDGPQDAPCPDPVLVGAA